MSTKHHRQSLLLITPENRELHQFRKRQFNNFVQLTMPYLAGFVDETRYRIRLIDEYNQRIPYESRPDLVAITVNTPNATHCYEIAASFRARGSRVVFGGPHPTLNPEEAAGHCDHLIEGEAEETWPEFLEAFLQGVARPRYVCSGTPSLHGIPIPRRDLIRRRPFTKGSVFATRGCPFNCQYCSLKRIYGGGFRTRPVEEVLVDIRSMRHRHFVFWDDNFFGDADYAAALMEALKGLGRHWAAQVTVDRCADERLLRLARESGCVYLFIGLESFSKESLASVNKGFSQVDHYRQIIELIHQHRICVQAGIIFGFDHDTKEVFRQTLQRCEELGIDGVTPSLLTPLPGTQLYEDMKQAGRLIGRSWADFNGKTRVALAPRNMTPEELLAGYHWFRRSFYSFRSIYRRLSVSRANPLHQVTINLGYKWSLGKVPSRV